jgi:hypothetical protein
VEPSEVVRGWGGFAPDDPALAALRRRTSERLRAVLRLGPEVVIVPPRTLPRSEGKAVRVVERTA